MRVDEEPQRQLKEEATEAAAEEAECHQHFEAVWAANNGVVTCMKQAIKRRHQFLLVAAFPGNLFLKENNMVRLYEMNFYLENSGHSKKLTLSN
jgi:hypothetical protein